jgi:carbamoyl-phosphate synthase large subunit
MNILLTCIGRRNYIVDYFKDALLSTGGKVFVTNSHPNASGFIPADGAFIVPGINEPTYIDTLIRICRDFNIKAVIPLFDPELPILSNAHDKFLHEGIFPVISSPKIIEICDDKWETYSFLKNSGFYSPKTFMSVSSVMENLQKDEVHYPLILKPRWGMGSIGVFEVCNRDELEIFYKRINKLIYEKPKIFIKGDNPEELILIQEKMVGEEYGLDIINDLDAIYMATIPKKKIAIRAGETDIASTVQSPELITLGEKISKNLHHIGILDVDIIMTNSGPAIIDMNARIGGGYPFSHLAGINFPKALISWLSGNPSDPSDFSFIPNVMGSKGLTPLINHCKYINASEG